MTIPVYSDIEKFREACDSARAAGQRVALVPTLGALTPAHEQLIERARQHADAVMVSVFVNPTQFGPGEDLDRYPRQLEADVAVCERRGAVGVLSPPKEQFYPPGEATRVVVSRLTEHLCGSKRPGHFAGVATIVAKLLVLTGPGVAVFGRKDFQQLRVIQRLCRDLCLPTEIVEQPLVRDADGLASSSRNRYLSVLERQRALRIPRALASLAEAFDGGEREASVLSAKLSENLEGSGLDVEYAQLMTTAELQPVSGKVAPGSVGAFIAARVGNTRLIDNHIFGEDAAPQVAG